MAQARAGWDTTPLSAALPQQLAHRSPRIVVVGDSILDGWLGGRCRRLSREAAAPVLEVDSEHLAPGGAANTAVNLSALGADVEFLSVTGDDSEGRELLSRLRAAGVGVGNVVVGPGRATPAKRRLVAGDQVLARFDVGGPEPLGDQVRSALLDRLDQLVGTCDAVLCGDYGLGVLDGPVRDSLAAVRRRLPLLVVDAHDLGPWRALRPDLVTPNADEAAALLGLDFPEQGTGRAEAVERAQAGLLEATGAEWVVVTLDRDGSLLLSDSSPAGRPAYRTWAEPAPERNAAGAGDTFVSALSIALAAGLPVTTGVELGQMAADEVVSHPGTSVCDTEQLTRRLRGYAEPVAGPGELAAAVERYREEGRRVVFTNGCFDVLHRGHVGYLNQAKRLGDVLIVGVNSDASVRRLKGPGRPVNPAGDRVAVLASLSCVDHVTVYGEDTSERVIEELRPDVYVKGGDYTPEMLPETPVVRRLGGEVVVVDYLGGFSTSGLIDRIRGDEPAGAGSAAR